MPKTFQETLQTRLESLQKNVSKEFILDKISKSPARFNLDKLKWFNREYIKMLSLEEFCYRATKLKVETKDNELNYRVGDYVYFVDVEKQKILINKSISSSGQDGNFYCIGGGREDGEDGQESLIREIREETNNNINIDKNKLIFVQKIFVKSEHTWFREDKKYYGKEMNFWFYPISMLEISPFVLSEEDFGVPDQQHEWWFDWFDVSEVISTNQYLTYPIWKQFCAENDLQCFEKSEQVKQQYLSWNLDKNRATLLSDFDTDSNTILGYLKPTLEQIKWKKISVEESLKNLDEIEPIIKGIYTKLEEKQNELYESNPNQINQVFCELAQEWEIEIKKWLTENQKDKGSYLWPLRVCLSGKEKSPSPFELLSILTQKQSEERMKSLTQYLAK
jgi:glutamyl/glutaminyl-tRNA synthetase